MTHNIPIQHIEKLTKGPSQAKVASVANLQNYIQELLGDTHHTFLQGSYKNDTAISDINDVDIVAVRSTTYSGTFSTQPCDRTILWDQIFSEIEYKLGSQSRYNWTVTRDDKCIKVRGAFNADVVPAVQVNTDPRTDPIVIYSFKAGQEKINYPRVHYDNGVAKHGATDEAYKPVVRMFKNWTKNHFGDTKVVSSHQIESLVHAAENTCFSSDFAISFILVAADIDEKLKQRDVLAFKIPSVCGYEDISAN
ncbi:MAG: nucleotidyltransferase, partial [Patescibacteria group bacterium]